MLREVIAKELIKQTGGGAVQVHAKVSGGRQVDVDATSSNKQTTRHTAIMSAVSAARRAETEVAE